MPKLNIVSGTKLELQLLGKQGQKPLGLKSSFEKAVGKNCLLISAPFYEGNYANFEHQDALNIQYWRGTSKRILFGYIEGSVQRGLRNYWRVKIISEEREFVFRAYERIKTGLRVSYTGCMPENQAGEPHIMYALSYDISAGGISLRLHGYVEPEALLELNLPPLGTIKGFTQKAEVRWIMATENNKAFSYAAGMRFVFANAEERENMKAYIFALIRMHK